MTEPQGEQPAKKWLVMLYIASDDKRGPEPGATLTDNCGAMLRGLQDASIDLNNVAIVALTDSPYSDATAKVEDDGLERERPKYKYMTPAIRTLQLKDGKVQWEKVEDLPSNLKAAFYPSEDEAGRYLKLASGSYETLAAFVEWALGLEDYRDRHTMLSIVGHGGGWSPGFHEIEPLLFSARERALLGQSINRQLFRSEQFDQFLDTSSLVERHIRALTSRRRADNLSPVVREFQGKKGGTVSAYPGLCPDYSKMTAYDPPPTISTRGLGVALEAGIGALGSHRKDETVKKLDVVFLDACLMGMAEVAYEIKEAANILLAGEDLLYARLPYDRYLQGITSQTPEELARWIVQVYNIPDQDLTQKSWGLAAINLAKMFDLRKEINSLAALLLQAIESLPLLQFVIFEAYDRAQKLDYDADQSIDQRREGFVDLYDFLDRLYILLSSSSPNHSNSGLDALRAQIAALQALLIGYAIEIRLNNPQLLGVLETSDTADGKPANRESDTVIISSRTQTDSEGVRDLSRAYGLSIYLPLGEPDDRHRDVPDDLQDVLLDHGRRAPTYEQYFHGETYPSIYIYKQLRFTDENDNSDPLNRRPTAWARLVEKLMTLRFMDDTRRRNLYERPYRAPRQLGFRGP